MTTKMVWPVVVAMTLTALAGCLNGDDATPDEFGGGPSLVLDENHGGVRGIVQDDEYQPIRGAQVGILGTELITLTGEAGLFQIGGLEPGTYQVAAQALGYSALSKRVEVIAGQAVEVEFVLEKLRGDDPWVLTEIHVVTVSAIMWKLTPTCIYTDINPLVKTCGGVRTGCSPSGACEKHYRAQTLIEEDPKTIVVEIAWQAQTGVSGRGFHIDLNAPNITRGSGGSINQDSPYTFQAASDRSPIAHRVDIPETLIERGIPESDWYSYPDNSCTAAGSNNCDWFYRIFAAACDLGICPDGFGPDYGIMEDGRGTVYVSIFYRDPAQDGYTLVPDQ